MAEKETSQLEMKALLEGYPSLKQILQNIKQVVWILDLSTDQILYVSPAFEIVWGRSCESLYADPLTLIKSVHPEDRVKVMSASPDDNRKSLNQSYRILRPDGSLRWISAHTFLIREESSDTSYQVCIAQDITDQNQVDQTLRKALDRSREQFTLSRRMSLARKPEAVLKTLMSASELRSAKRAFVLFFESPLGGPSHEIEVITSWSSVPVPGQSQSKRIVERSQPVRRPGFIGSFPSLKAGDRHGNLERPTPDTRGTRSAAGRANPNRGHFPAGRIRELVRLPFGFFPQEKHFEPVELRHIKVLVDQATITLYNLQLLEIEAESRHEAERANEIKTRFLAMISHELRTPLTSIKGFTTTLLAEDVTWEPEEQRDFIQTIQQEANRLQELIDHLLDLSRLEAGMLPIAPEPHSLQEIIEDALPQFQVMTQRAYLIFAPARQSAPCFCGCKAHRPGVGQPGAQCCSPMPPKGLKSASRPACAEVLCRLMSAIRDLGFRRRNTKRVFKAFQRGVKRGEQLGARRRVRIGDLQRAGRSPRRPDLD